MDFSRCVDCPVPPGRPLLLSPAQGGCHSFPDWVCLRCLVCEMDYPQPPHSIDGHIVHAKVGLWAVGIGQSLQTSGSQHTATYSMMLL